MERRNKSRSKGPSEEPLRALSPAELARYTQMVSEATPRLLQRATSLTSGDHHKAEDLVQQTLLNIYHAMQKGTFANSPIGLPFLYTTLRNLSVDSWRRKQARPQEDPTEGIEGISDNVSSDPVGDYVTNNDLVKGCLEQLVPHHRKIIELLYLDDLTMEQVASALGIPLGTVKSRAWYALRQLREIFVEQPEEEDSTATRGVGSASSQNRETSNRRRIAPRTSDTVSTQKVDKSIFSDNKQWEEVIAEVVPELRTQAKAILGANHPDVEDVIQSVLADYFSAVQSGTFLSRTALDRKVVARSNSLIAGNKREVSVPTVAKDTNGYEDNILTRQAVRDEIKRLREKYRSVLELKYYKNLTDKQIAEMLNIALSTVVTRLSETKSLLRRHLQSESNDA